jgi:NADH dehydrogenase
LSEGAIERVSSEKEKESRRPHVVVIGAGFGGLEAARVLADASVDVTIIDRHNYHTFQPLLYQVATAGLEPGQIAHTVRGIFQAQERVQFRLGTVVDVDPDQRHVRLQDGRTVPYDSLIVAAGTEPQYYGIPGVREHAYALKSLADAANLRSHVLRQFEQATVDDASVEEGGLRFVVVGGGPTGVEMAGALVELFDRVLDEDFPEVDVSDAEVVLVEMADSVLPPYDSTGRDYALRTLRDRSVEVRLGEAVERATDQAVYLKGGERLPAQTLIWAAGVQANTLAEALPSPKTDGGRVVVDEQLRLLGYESTYVIGDMAAATDGEGDPLPQLAPVAVQEGRYVARRIQRCLRGEPTEPFAYDDPGMMATIGRNAAVVETSSGFQVTGFVAWLMWTVLHIWELIGFRNRLSVMLDWIYSYFTHDRSARLIFEAASDSTPTSEPSKPTAFRS